MQNKIGDSTRHEDGHICYFDGLKWVQPLKLMYRNYRGVVLERHVLPISIYYGTTEFYPKPCHIMYCWDIHKQDYRHFCLTNIVKML